MTAIFILAIKDLRRQWGLALILSALFSVTFAAFLSLITYQQSENRNYANLGNNWLVVGSSRGFGEIYDSRLTNDVGERLKGMGYQNPLPEIREVIGTRASNLVMLRGARLDSYADVTPYRLMAGRSFGLNESPRSAMVGTLLARNKDLTVGGTISLKGHEFNIIGIFETGAMEDNQVWISLDAAQDLLGYRSDVSIYLIPNNGVLQEGDLFAEGISISRKGENGRLFDHSIQAFFKFMGLVAILAGVASVITLINLLWRLAYLHRREFGIMKTLGFRLNAFIFYFTIQAGIILGIGFLAGVGIAVEVLFKRVNRLTVFGYGIPFFWDFNILGIVLGVGFLVFCVGVIAPLLNIQRTSIPELLGRN